MRRDFCLHNIHVSNTISALGEEHEGGMQVPRRLGILRAQDVLAERRTFQSGEYVWGFVTSCG